MTRRESRPRGLSLLLLLQVLAVATAAAAGETDQAEPGKTAPGETDPEARRHFERGTLRFDEGRYREAIEHFEAAYEATSAPELLYNIGRCHEELGQRGLAVAHYERYLEQQEGAEDTAEVRGRIARISLAAEAAEDDDQEDAEAALAGSRLGITLGAAHPVIGEWDRTMVPLSAVLHLPLLEWLFFSGWLGYAGFAGEKPKVVTGYPTSSVDLAVGLTGVKRSEGLLSFFGSVGVGTAFLFRHHHATAYWLSPRIALGLAIDFFESWSATVEATGSFGPVFNPKRTSFDPWDPPGPTADAGGRIGILYSF